MAPSAIATAHGMSGRSQCATTATAVVVTPTATSTSVETGSQLLRRSRSEVSNAASSSTGATNSASARSGSSVQDGPDGRNASSVPPSARNVGYGTLSRRASADSTTAPSSKPISHSNVVKPALPVGGYLAVSIASNRRVIPAGSVPALLRQRQYSACEGMPGRGDTDGPVEEFQRHQRRAAIDIDRMRA